jgi:hypothetical protein
MCAAPHPRWMADESLDGRPLASLCLPGSHDSGAYRLEHRLAPSAAQQSSVAAQAPRAESLLRALGWMPVIVSVSRAQRLDVRQQLDAGIRLLDLRICAHDGELWIHHGLIGPPLAEVVADIAAFVAEHPGQLIVVRASHFAMGDTPHASVVELVSAQLDAQLIRRHGSEDPRSRRLGELRDVDGPSRVMWFHEPDDGNDVGAVDDRFWGSSTALYGDHWCPRATSVDELARCQGQACRATPEPFHLQWILTPQPLLVGVDWCRRQLRLPGRDYGLASLAPIATSARLRTFLDAVAPANVAAISVDMFEQSEVVPIALARCAQG